MSNSSNGNNFSSTATATTQPRRRAGAPPGRSRSDLGKYFRDGERIECAFYEERKRRGKGVTVVAYDSETGNPIYPGPRRFSPEVNHEGRPVRHRYPCLVLWNKAGTAGFAMPEHPQVYGPEVWATDPQQLRDLYTADLTFTARPRRGRDGTDLIATLPDGKIVMALHRFRETIPVGKRGRFLLIEQGTALFARPLSTEEQTSDDAFALAIQDEGQRLAADEWVAVNSGGIIEQRNVFEILGVPRTATLAAIKAALRKKLAEVNPDVIVGGYRKATGTEPDVEWVSTVEAFAKVVAEAGRKALEVAENRVVEAAPDSIEEPEPVQAIKEEAEPEVVAVTGELDMTIDAEAPATETNATNVAPPKEVRRPAWLSAATLNLIEEEGAGTPPEPLAAVKEDPRFPSLGGVLRVVAQPATQQQVAAAPATNATDVAPPKEERQRELRKDLKPLRRQLILSGHLAATPEDYEPQG